MTPHWIAIDWGSSALRLWTMTAEGDAGEAVRSDQGAAMCAPDDFEPALLALLARWLPEAARLPVVICGMAGARQGWVEAPYAEAPCAPPGLAQAARPVLRDDRLDVRILPGVSQREPADVMRGEETQIAGFLAANPGFDGALCLPGTHSKWARVEGGAIRRFQSFMTGELFALLARASVLRHCVGETGWNADAFAEATTQAMAAPEAVAASLFALRANALLNGLPPETARARLSGLLIGLELAGARAYWRGRPVAVIGAAEVAGRYASALGASARMVDGEAMALDGLRAAWRTQ